MWLHVFISCSWCTLYYIATITLTQLHVLCVVSWKLLFSAHAKHILSTSQFFLFSIMVLLYVVECMLILLFLCVLSVAFCMVSTNNFLTSRGPFPVSQLYTFLTTLAFLFTRSFMHTPTTIMMLIVYILILIFLVPLNKFLKKINWILKILTNCN